MNVNPQRYLKALFLACQNSARASLGRKNVTLVKKSVDDVLQLEGDYDAVVICLGSKIDFLPGLTGKLPLRTCRGVITHLQLHESAMGSYPECGPSILSDAWLAVQGPRNLHMGSTWEWQSRNYSSDVSAEEASRALAELLPKASAVYPEIDKWEFVGARAGLRAMPPVTSHGSLPLLGCVNQLIGAAASGGSCKFWVFGGLGSRGLLYHGWLGKLMANAVLCCKEELIPFELTTWKKNSQ
uniref:FAD dependent oxidoreductase domain-containing protein n=1 Tax=Noccaea caerulescens TaxID=107243 RepID=A0A1J3DHZ8_NOCCA